MITKVITENFKRFDRQEFELAKSIVLAGPNNSGKSTLLQAVSTWSMALERWRLGKGRRAHSGPTPARVRAGQAVTRKDFTALPLRDFKLLWHKTMVALSKAELGPRQSAGAPRPIRIRLEGARGFTRTDMWSLTMELRHQSTEQIYVKPLDLADGKIPPAVDEMQIVHCPPFSGIGAEERRLDRGAQQLEIGRGRLGDILRNLLFEVHHVPDQWNNLVEDIQNLFRVTLLPPEYDESVPFILCEYLDGIPKHARSKNGLTTYDIASGGSGFHQVLLLLSFFYARPASVFLLDEPDAHLHVILQRQIYERLGSVAERRACQLIIATHSEVILESTPPHRVISFLGKPHRLVDEAERDRLGLAMSELSSLDLLLAEQGRAVLYCEGESDFSILEAWARALRHAAVQFFDNPFKHVNRGRQPKRAKSHLLSLRSIHPDIRGLLLLDKDDRNLPDREVVADGLRIIRWKRYEIENYLIVPDAVRRFLAQRDAELFAHAAAEKAMDYLKSQLPGSFFEKPLSNETKAIVEIPAKKQLLPQMFEAAGQPLDPSDYKLLAEIMKPDEVHPDVIAVLDEIAALTTSSQT